MASPLCLQGPVSQLHPAIHLVLPHRPKIGPSSSSHHRNRVFLWCEIISKARLKWTKHSTSGTVGLLTDLWVVLPSFLSLERTGLTREWQVGLRGTDPASCCLLAELVLLWEYYIALMDFLQLWLTCYLLWKKNVKWYTIKHVRNRRAKTHF